MASVVVRNSRAGDEPLSPEVREDGTLYPFCMFFDGFKYAVYADTPTELVAALIPGYASMTEEQDKLRARITLAIGAQVATQAEINAEQDPQVWDALSAEEKDVLVGPRFEQPRVDFWNSEIPLVLVETGYAPYTELDKPISGIADVVDPPNIIWLRPMDEWDLITSLVTAGFIALHEAADL